MIPCVGINKFFTKDKNKICIAICKLCQSSYILHGWPLKKWYQLANFWMTLKVPQKDTKDYKLKYASFLFLDRSVS